MKFKNYTIGLGLLLINFSACKNTPAERMFLIPSDYQGVLRIVYAEKCGAQPEEEDGKEVFQFEKNGLVILATDNGYGLKNEFYLLDDKGKRTRVNQISVLEDRFTKLPAILAGGETVSSSVVNTTNAETKTTSGAADCVDFYLYNTDTTKIEDAGLSEKLDKLTNALVDACRENK